MSDTDVFPESWCLRKPAVHSSRGVVVSQHILASRAGAQILAQGGNAVDAAVATGFAIGAVEPWMSGIGGGGYMVVYKASERKSYAVEFGVKSSVGTEPSAYPLVGGTGPDLFTWPSVQGDRNIMGPDAVAVPGMVAGLSQSLERFGSLDWQQVLAPAIRLAEQGIEVDWYGTLKIASVARDIARFEHTRDTFLPHGFVPVGEWAGPLPWIHLGALAETLTRLSESGAGDFYTGKIAQDILSDAAALGITLSRTDLASYTPSVLEAQRTRYRDSEVHTVSGLTAGPSLCFALAELSARPTGPESGPDADTYTNIANSLFGAYHHRLTHLGDVNDVRAPSCTTHINVADREGNLVALTITLLSLFGSKVTLPKTGILMNNGIMWFDPRPGHPNSIAPAKRPLSNMCPTVVVREDGHRFALGASGGRRIMPAVFQLVSFLIDHGMSVEDAMHHPRVDVSGSETVTLDAAIPDSVRGKLSATFKTQSMPNGVYPNMFACPSAVSHDPEKSRCSGAAFVASPKAAAAVPGV